MDLNTTLTLSGLIVTLLGLVITLLGFWATVRSVRQNAASTKEIIKANRKETNRAIVAISEQLQSLALQQGIRLPTEMSCDDGTGNLIYRHIDTPATLHFRSGEPNQHSDG